IQTCGEQDAVAITPIHSGGIKMKRSIFLFFGLILAIMTAFVSATDNQIPNDIQTAIVDALTKADQISLTEETEQSRELINTVRGEFTDINEKISDYSNS